MATCPSVGHPARPPSFHLPWNLAFGLGADVLAGKERPFLGDCTAMVRQMQPRARVTGLHHIPRSGSFVLLANHYEGPGLWIGWTAALLTHAVAQVRPAPAPLHWLVTGAMDRRRVGGIKRLAPGTGWFFARIARTWGMVALPGAEDSPARRAVALRRLVGLAAPPSGGGEPVGFFPEGEGDGIAGLRPPRPGSGALLLALARRGVPALPAGVWSAGGRLQARFGEPWLPSGTDGSVRQEVMMRFAELTGLQPLAKVHEP